MNNYIRIFLIALAAMMSVACEDATIIGTGTGTGTGGTGTPPATVVTMSLSAGLSTLSAGGSTGLTVTFLDQNGVPFTGPVSVTFSSNCISVGTAQTTSTTVQPTTTGTIQATYTDQGCGQSDTITASSAANGQTLTASVAINVLPASVGSIRFISATPTVIGIRGGGSGLPEQSQLVFTVLNTASGPAAGRVVTFTLNNTAGGITFADGTTTTTSTSASDGTVGVTVRAGTVLTSVRVTATFTPTSGSPISTQSSSLTVSTGFPDQNSFSLSVDQFNNGGFDCDGEIALFDIRAADRNNNPVPKDTAITFTTEGGDVEGTCFTGPATTGLQEAGICTSTWESQNPRPADGRTTVLAYAEGEESFVDLNSNGFFDTGDSFTDLGEAFHDFNENGLRDDASEPYIEFNGTAGFQSAGDGKYNGLLCKHPTLCGLLPTVTVRQSIVLVMGTGDPFVENADVTIDNVVSDIDVNFIGGKDLVEFSIVVRDVNDQIMPAGTTVAISNPLGSVLGGASTEVLSSNDSSIAANTFTFSLKGPEGAVGNSDVVLVTVTVPASACDGELIKTYSFRADYTPRQCSDGVDNEGTPDTKIDFPADPQCTSATDNDEAA